MKDVVLHGVDKSVLRKEVLVMHRLPEKIEEVDRFPGLHVKSLTRSADLSHDRSEDVVSVDDVATGVEATTENELRTRDVTLVCHVSTWMGLSITDLVAKGVVARSDLNQRGVRLEQDVKGLSTEE